MSLTWSVIFIVSAAVVVYQRVQPWVISLVFGILLFLFSFFHSSSLLLLIFCWGIWLGWVMLFNFTSIRCHVMTRPLFMIAKKLMPKISETEAAVLESGGLGWEAEVFRGKPSWKKLLSIPAPQLTDEERDFLEGPVEKLCQMVDNWQIAKELKMPDEIWAFLKTQGFFGLIIPKKYGGKEFSELAHSAVIVKTASINTTLGTAVSVPNSLGPAELLLHYGTEEQKNYYLPRLAKGEEIPCFALTSPVAGSDAASLIDNGIVCEAEINGKKQKAIRLNWDKRYITLSPIATLIGLAFKLYDPDHLVGDKEYLGITCALIPRHTPGVHIGRRHIPLRAGFPNGPIQGHDVLIPLDGIIGGIKMAGHGWRMLMDCLGTGRAISLPSMVNGSCKRGAIATGAYARIRQQFHTSLFHFEGVSEALTQIAADSYLLEVLRLFTVNNLDQGEPSSVASAISKYHTTELGRKVIQHAMDIHGGKGIIMGPKNYLAQMYMEAPISITVEGANILTRSLIIFGQGALRCHPYLLEEVHAAQRKDLTAFDKALFGHLGYLISNKARASWLALTGGIFTRAPAGQLKRYFQLITRYSAAFAYIADVSILMLGSKLKFKEKLSARLGDLLSDLYMMSAVLKHFRDQGQQPEEKIIAQYVCQKLLFHFQHQLDGLLRNLPIRWIGKYLRLIVFPWGRRLKAPSDRLGQQVAELLTRPSFLREFLKKEGYFTPHPNNFVGNMEEVFEQILEVEPLEKKVKELIATGRVQGKILQEHVAHAVQQDLMTEGEAQRILGAEAARQMIIAVDDFKESDIG